MLKQNQLKVGTDQEKKHSREKPLCLERLNCKCDKNQNEFGIEKPIGSLD